MDSALRLLSTPMMAPALSWNLIRQAPMTSRLSWPGELHAAVSAAYSPWKRLGTVVSDAGCAGVDAAGGGGVAVAAGVLAAVPADPSSGAPQPPASRAAKIGRASCRERA